MLHTLFSTQQLNKFSDYRDCALITCVRHKITCSFTCTVICCLLRSMQLYGIKSIKEVPNVDVTNCVPITTGTQYRDDVYHHYYYWFNVNTGLLCVRSEFDHSWNYDLCGMIVKFNLEDLGTISIQSVLVGLGVMDVVDVLEHKDIGSVIPISLC